MPKATNSPLDRPLRVVTLPSTVYTGEVGIAVRVSSDSDKLPRLPKRGDTYRQANICQVRMGEFKDFVCTEIDGQGEYIWVYFSKNRTAFDITPYKKPTTEMGNHPWPLVLKRIDIKRHLIPTSVTAGENIYKGVRYSATPYYYESADTGTLFELREYIHTTEPDTVQHETPQPQPINFPLPGSSPFSFPASLHKKIDIEAMQETYADEIVDATGTSFTQSLGVFAAVSFPATNFTTWIAHVLYDRSTKLSTGAFHQRQMWVHPPSIGKLVKGG